ncbi:hypothetical protein GH714_026589 [Hevea brasiliensis]|uniref:mitogen-activated protein kinase kinase n=1 Tax=Hevea brasiliensis TaxID=3981 RepID=A0A6A6N6S9_HEVBR|nr:hypothetical protein GH714_026589 [Hevea brasiliensis]
MKRKGKRALNHRKGKLKLSLPQHGVCVVADFLTPSGTFVDGDLCMNRDGIQIISQRETEAAPPIKPSGQQLALADLETIKVLGEGTDGIVQLVQHKRTQHFFAIKAPPIKPSDHQLALADLETIKVIGKGSSGIVQLVRHKWTEQFFALKAIQLKIEEKARKAIARELRINLTSQCPYVVKFYESFFNNGDISIVLEYMDGGSLAEHLKKRKKITEPYVAAICKQVLQGLLYLHHEKHIIHGDLKPSTILINHKGEVKIADFGPERISSEISEGSHNYKSDIWSMGIVLLECATGQFPYSPPDQGEVWANVFELMEAIVEQPEPCGPSDQFSPEFCSFISSW